MNFNNCNNWIILNKIENSINSKIENNGIRLEEWNVKINYGIKTGYNDAFIIDEATKNMLIEADPKSVELIRPILRGKDIKKYTYKFSNRYIITIPCGFTNINKSGNAEIWFRETYPALYNHFINIEKTLSENRSEKSKGLFKRDDQGDYWWELRSCKYMDDFYEQNIAWQRITHENTFCLTSSNMVILDSMAFINGAKDKTYYLLAILNSSLVKFWIKKNVPEYGSTGYRLSNQFVTQIPIPTKIDDDILKQINILVKEYYKGIDNLNEINIIVNQIYNLNEIESDYIISEKYLNQ